MALNIREIVGFTLIELMIAVTVVAILAAIAYPSYQEAVTQSRRIDAISTLLRLQVEQEKFRSRNPFYANQLNQLSTRFENNTHFSDEGHYVLKLSGGDASSYRLLAIPAQGGKQVDDTCTKFEINQHGPLKDSDLGFCWNE